MPGAVIEAREVSRTYDIGAAPVEALKSASLTVRKGDFVSIMGPSGSGKTSLMNILGLLDTPSGGTLLFDGEDMSGADDDERSAIRALRIGFVFQTFNLISWMSAWENVELPLLYGPFGEKEASERVHAALESVGLSHRAGHRPAELSGGEAQRVAIARALAAGPLVILADEPTGNLDTRTGERILDIFERLNEEEGATILVVTHDERVAAHSRRMMRIVDGELFQ
ncbi:MAG: ABC transporter ATP-binding protein [Candidatus Nitrospinota bacterium M3_3B_026]